jgi:DNA-binding helix-hairpin-helix protein with protein kinase domain
VAKTRRLYDSHGCAVDLGPQIASGGEGAIYSLPGASQAVAKVYHKPSAYKAEKLSAMVRDCSPDLLKFAAWPTATLHETRNGALTGFIMPKASGQEIHTLYGPAHRRSAFPKADWAFLIHTAMNCATAFDAIHAKNYVIGDVNQSNILASPEALVFLIDCDSFQVRTNGRLFPCEVGVAQYTPPELQEANFRQVIRTANHDRFGLAVLLFHLLFMGRHPFAGRFLGRGEMLLEQAIKEFRFAYAAWASRAQMAPPPFSLHLEVLSPELAKLFDRAFRPGSEAVNGRPTAAEWRFALASFQKLLMVCPADPGHKVPRHLKGCPWCEIMRIGGPDFFVGVAMVELVFGADLKKLSQLWAHVESTPDLSLEYERPRVHDGQEIEPTISAGDFASDQTALWAVGSAALLGALALLAAVCFAKLAFFGVPIVLVFGIWWFVLAINSPLSRAKRQKQREWRAISEELDQAESELRNLLSQSQHDFNELKANLAQMRDSFRRLQAEYDAERRQMEANKEAIQREQFLQTKFISDAVERKEIPGIGAGRVVLLESHGIETASNISEQRVLEVRGFGPVLVSNLLAWKQQVALGFRFDPKKSVPEAELRALTQKYKQKQDLLRARLERGALDLQAISRRARDQLRATHHGVQKIIVERAQVEVDLAALSGEALR